MNKLRLIVTGFTSYRGGVGQLSFMLDRLTGLGTLTFLVVHILDTSTVYFFPELYEVGIAIYRSTPFLIGEIFLVFSVIYHGVNGARIAIFDLYLVNRWQKPSQHRSAIWTLAIAVVLWLPAAYLMGRNLLINNFGL